MIGQLVITFREGFEAILLVSILVGYLKRTGRSGLIRYAYYGVVLALLIGLIVSLLVMLIYGEFESELFEGVSALIAALVLTYMIYWMARRKSIRGEVESKVRAGRTTLGIMMVAFVFAVREVIETILFLTPFAASDAFATVYGAVLGLGLAALLALLLSRSIMKVDLRKFFYYSSILLIFIAGGLVGYGAHELLEFSEDVGFESFLHTTVFDLGIEENSILHHKNILGSFLSVMFGYTVKAELGRVLAHALYLSIAFPMLLRSYSPKLQTKKLQT